ncbi:MAG: anthranilate phosphoribosyltransferase [Actinomycetales bacterium]|nr:anthranilate phosphoribosyltransferase [Actinomycetales bacterium]
MTADPRGWDVAAALAQVAAGADLTSEQAAAAMAALMAGGVPDDTTAQFLVALRAKGETRDEVSGFLTAMRAAGRRVDVPGPVADVVGTGGDGHHSVNISTMAAVVLAATGVPVVKHGNRAATSLCGAADVLAELGVAIDLGPEQVRECLQRVGISFCLAPVFHPAMRHVAAVRRGLGHPTVFNLLGPLANPAGAAVMLVGVADATRAELVAAVLADSGVRAAVVCAEDGMDEVSTAVPTSVWAGGSSAVIDPAALGLASAAAQDLAGGVARHNAEVFRGVLDPQSGQQWSAVRDCVVLNAAVARAVWSGAGSAAQVAQSTADEMPLVRAAIADGSAQTLLTRWVEVSRALAEAAG